MESNKLKLNEKKMEAMVVGSQSLTSVSGTGHLEIGSCLISFQLNVKDLGVFLNSGLTVCDHISSVCHSAYLELRGISSIHLWRGGPVDQVTLVLMFIAMLGRTEGWTSGPGNTHPDVHCHVGQDRGVDQWTR